MCACTLCCCTCPAVVARYSVYIHNSVLCSCCRKGCYTIILHWFVTAVHCVVVVIVTIARMHLLDSVYMLFALEVGMLSFSSHSTACFVHVQNHGAYERQH